MSRARIAELRQQLADMVEQLQKLADELDGEPEEAAPRAPRSKPRRRVKAYPAPLHPVSDLDRMRAVKMLRRRGVE